MVWHAQKWHLIFDGNGHTSEHQKKLRATYLARFEQKEQERLRAMQFTGPNTTAQLSAVLSRIASDPNGVSFFAELEQLQPGTLQDLGTPGAIVTRVQQYASSANYTGRFTGDSEFVVRNSHLLNEITQRAQGRTGGLVRTLSQSISQGMAIREQVCHL